MNKEEYAIDEKTYENYDGLKIKIIFLKTWHVAKIKQHPNLVVRIGIIKIERNIIKNTNQNINIKNQEEDIM